jgi:hypothetical protein
MATYQKWFAGIVWTTLAAVIFVFWSATFRFSYNFPYYDDFQNLIQFICNFIQADSALVKTKLLFEQNFEHRVVFAKLLTLLQYLITGQVSIKWLIFLGNLSLLGTVFIFARYLSKKQISLLALLTMTCLLFQAQHYEDTISWATCSLQHAPCLFFSLWSFHLALARRNAFASGSLALLALFTSANGLSTVVIWLGIVFLTSKDRKKIIVPAILSLSITLAHLLTLTIHSGSLVTHATSNVGHKFILLLSFAGQLADSNVIGQMGPSIVLGALFLSPLVVIMVKLISGRQGDISTLQWLCGAGIATLVFVAFLIVFARGTDPDYDGFKMDRYKIYAAFFGVFAVAFYDGYWPAVRFGNMSRLAFAGSALVFSMASYYAYYGSIVNYRKTILANQYNYKWSKAIYYPVIYFDPQTPLFMSFAKKNFFQEPPLLPFSEIDWKMVQDSIPVRKMDNGETYDLSNTDWMDTTGPADMLYAVAVDPVSSRPKYLISADHHYQRAVKQFITTLTRPTSQGFSCVIFKKELAKGTYDIYLVPIKKGQVSRAFKLDTIIV